MQGRFGFPSRRRSPIETQADCFAGAWTALGRRRQRRARLAARARARRRHPRLPAAARPGRQRPQRAARRTAPTSTASPPSTRASTAAWTPAATTSATTGSSPRPRSTDDSDIDTGGQRRRTTRSSTGRRRRCRSSGPRSFPTAFGKDFTPPDGRGASTATAPDCAGVAGPRPRLLRRRRHRLLRRDRPDPAGLRRDRRLRRRRRRIVAPLRAGRARPGRACRPTTGPPPAPPSA